MKPLLALFFAMIATAAHSAETQLPTEHNPKSDIWIDYSDLDYVLSSSVFDMGPSRHQRAGRVLRDSGTRIYGGNRKASRFEGNRVLFHLFEDKHHDVLRVIRDDLLALPGDADLETLSRNHQLAYWLNLHNAIVLVEMAERYPFNRVEPMFDRDRASAFVNQKGFDWNGQMISIADIQDHVLANWRDPLVIYGFYMGAVGTPNIRQDAFKGDSVYDQLRENAFNFVNSVRGTQLWTTGELRVASYYERMAAVFPNFEDDVLRHVQEYARPNFARRLVGIASVDARIEDWNIADIYNGHLHQAGRTGPSVTLNAVGELLAQAQIPLHVTHLLRGRMNNFRRFKGTVDIEEVAAGTSEETDEEQTTDETDDTENEDDNN